MANSSAGSPVAACGGSQQPVAVQRLRRRKNGVVGVGATPAERATSRRSMSTNRPGQRQVRPVGVGGDMEQHDPPGAPRRLRHQRRAVRQRRPGVARRGRPTVRPAPGGSPSPRPAPPARRTASSRGTAPARPARSRTARRPAADRRPAACTGISGSVSPIGCSAVRGPAKRISSPPFSTHAASASRSAPPAAAGRPGPARRSRAAAASRGRPRAPR